MRAIAKITWIIYVFSLVVQLIRSNGETNRTISDVYVNLPATCQECTKVQYEITAFSGCYNWTTNNPEIIAVNQILDKNIKSATCYSSARLTPAVSRPMESVVLIKATDTITKDGLISQAKVSRISQIKILTNFKAIEVGDVQKLYIQAFDESNNVMSTVEGLRFEWRIETNQAALRMISSMDANYENTPIRLQMEARRQQTDLLLVKGMQTGIVEVSAKLLEKDYEAVEKATITLFVIEPFYLIPGEPIRLLTMSKFKYRIAKGKKNSQGRLGHGSHMEVPLPSLQYQFTASDSSMLKAWDDGNVETQKITGEVLVRVKDTSIRNHTVEGLIYVVDGDKVLLNNIDVTGKEEQMKAIIMGGDKATLRGLGVNCGSSSQKSNWNFVLGHSYLLYSCLFDNAQNPILLTGNIEFDLEFKDDIFKEIWISRQKEFAILQATNIAERGTKVRSVLKAEANSERAQIFDERDPHIWSKVKILHPTPEVILPFLPDKYEPQKWKMEATGGSLAYRWASSDSNIAPISLIGVVEGKHLGITTITVFDAVNSLNNDSIPVDVTPIQKLVWLEEKLELKMHGSEYLNLIALDRKNRKFTNCSTVPFVWQARDESVSKIAPEKNAIKRTYDELRYYVKSTIKDLIKLKFQFEEKSMDLWDDNVQLHNLFGICDQRIIDSVNVGVAKFTAALRFEEEMPMKLSEYAQVLVYVPLHTAKPAYNEYLWNLKESDRDQTHFRHMHELRNENEFVLGFGSGMLWEVEGGTKRWVDMSEKYTETVKVDKADMRAQDTEKYFKVVEINEDNIYKNGKPKHYLECNIVDEDNYGANDSGYKITLETGNTRTGSLLRPATNTIVITVWCQLPHSMQVTWAQNDTVLMTNEYVKFPKPSTEAEIEPDVYYLKSDGNYTVRMLTYDKYKRLFYNYSTYGLVSSSSDPSMGIITMSKKVDYMSSLRLTGHSGEFLVKGQLTKLIDPKNDKTIFNLEKTWDTMKIITVQYVRIEPEYKLLYLHALNKFKLTLIDGSGHFTVTTNSSQIVQVSYIQNSREIYVTPMNEGFVKVSVEDSALGNGYTVSSTILISDVHRMQLDQDIILEHGSTGSLQLNYFALTGERFPLEQYKFIRVSMQKEVKEIMKGLEKESASSVGIAIEQIQSDDPSKPHLFTVIAYQAGTYEVYAQKNTEPSSNGRKNVFSNSIFVEVFQKMEVKPGKLLLVPGGSYTIKTSGGPSEAILSGAANPYSIRTSSISRIFKIADPYIGSVDPLTGEVTGLHVGQTMVHVTITQTMRAGNSVTYVDLCKREVPVQVRIVTSVEIVGVYGRTVLTGSAIRAIGILKYYNETFTFGVFPVEYTFTSNNYNVFGIMVDKSNMGSSFDSNINAAIVNSRSDQQGVIGYAYKEGEADIVMSVVIIYPEPYTREIKDFSLRQSIKVVDPLYGLVNTFAETKLKETQFMIIPYNSIYKLTTNKDAKMKLNYEETCSRQSQVIEVTNEGKITSKERQGSTTIIIEENTISPRLQAFYSVQVLPIYSMMVEYGYTIINMPLGANVDLSILLLDSFGRAFAKGLEKGAMIEFDISHPKVLNAKLDYFNSTISISAVGLGASVIHVYYTDKERLLLDIIKIHVSSIIEPIGPIEVHLGGTVKFKTTSNYTQTNKASWESENTKIMSVDSRNGFGKAAGEGKTTIHINDTIQLSTSVSVLKIKQIKVENSTMPQYIANVQGSKLYQDSYNLVLRFFSDANEIPYYRKSNLIENNIYFDCKSLNPNFVSAKAIEGTEGKYNNLPLCVLTPSAYPLSEAPPKAISIQLVAGSRESNVEYLYETTITIPFLSSFALVDNSDKEITLYKNQRTKTISLYGSSNIKIFALDESLINVKSEYNSADNLISVKISVDSTVSKSFRNAKIRVENKVTDQQLTIFVSYFNEYSQSHDDSNKIHQPNKNDINDKQTNSENTTYYANIVAIILLVLMAFVIVKYILSNCFQSYKKAGNDNSRLIQSGIFQRVPAAVQERGLITSLYRTPEEKGGVRAALNEATELRRHVAYQTGEFKQ